MVGLLKLGIRTLCLLALTANAAAAFDVLSPQALVEKIGGEEKIVFVDVREPQEFAENHIPGAINMPQREFLARKNELDADAILVPYCNMDFRGFVSARALEDLGFMKVALMQERGINGWRAQGLPIAGPETGLSDREAMEQLRQVRPESLPGAKPFDRVAATGTVHELEMEVAEWYFEPNDLSVAPGDTLRIHLTSRTGSHHFIMPDFEVGEFVEEGETRTIEFVASRPGDFRFGSCEWDGEDLQVMKGRLRVESAQSDEEGR